jgi:purine-binding chemotaxis protein CheW
MANEVATNADLERFLNFSLDGGEFAITLDGILVVIPFPDFTKVPNTPKYFLGVMKLREVVIPVLDLRMKLGVSPTLDHETAVIVYNLSGETLGVVVDCINSVFSPTPDQILKVNSGGSQSASSGIDRSILKDGNLVLILDIPAIINTKDQVLLKDFAQKRAELDPLSFAVKKVA